MFIDGASIQPRKGNMTAPWTMTANECEIMLTQKQWIYDKDTRIKHGYSLTCGRALLINNAEWNGEEAYLGNVCKVWFRIVCNGRFFFYPSISFQMPVLSWDHMNIPF